MAIHNLVIWALSSQTYVFDPMLWTTDQQDDVLVYRGFQRAQHLSEQRLRRPEGDR